MRKRKIARKEWLNDTSNEVTLTKFRTCQREASNILKGKKIKYIQNVLETAELDYKAHRT